MKFSRYPLPKSLSSREGLTITSFKFYNVLAFVIVGDIFRFDDGGAENTNIDIFGSLSNILYFCPIL